jgi:SulP family sulfate permease
VLSAVSVIAPGHRLQAAILLAFLVGSLQIGITLLRLGDLTRYIPHSVILGFTLGVSALLVLDQWKNLVGLEAMGDVHDAFLVRFWLTITEGGSAHSATLAVGVGAVALVLRRVPEALGWPLLPDLLITVVALAAVTAWLDLESGRRQGRRRDPGQATVVRGPVLRYDI